MRKNLVIYAVVLITYLVLDFIWLGLVSKQSYQSAIGHLMRESMPIWPWVTFYLLYSFAVTKLVVLPAKNKQSAFVNGCIFGLASYGAFNLTNYTIIDSWPLAITFTDWAWGTFVSGVISTSGAFFNRLIQISN